MATTIKDMRGGNRFHLILSKDGKKIGEVTFIKLASSITPNGTEEVSRMQSFKKEFSKFTLPDAFTTRDDEGLLYPMPEWMRVAKAQ